jgi:hypothetical protein
MLGPLRPPQDEHGRNANPKGGLPEGNIDPRNHSVGLRTIPETTPDASEPGVVPERTMMEMKKRKLRTTQDLMASL